VRLIRSYAGITARWLAARAGYLVVNSSRYGLDLLADIKRLCAAWNYSVDVFLDVGANDGQTAFLAMHHFPAASVLSFEPHPSTFATLIANMGTCEKFQAFNLALGTAVGDCELFEYDDPVLNSLVPNTQFAVRFGKEARRVPVRSTTLDIFCSEHGIDSVGVLKIDTEGFELEVLRGGQGLLARRAVKFIYVEFNDLQPREHTFGGALLPIDGILRHHGYRFIATYNDYVVTQGEVFVVSNALFALPAYTDGVRQTAPVECSQ
jgi:FkbM family methyltransferase